MIAKGWPEGQSVMPGRAHYKILLSCFPSSLFYPLAAAAAAAAGVRLSSKRRADKMQWFVFQIVDWAHIS